MLRVELLTPETGLYPLDLFYAHTVSKGTRGGIFDQLRQVHLSITNYAFHEIYRINSLSQNKAESSIEPDEV